jgi:hypothetical protein
MKITIDFDKNIVIETLERHLRSMTVFAYKWLTTEAEALGYILGSLHFMTSVFLFLLVIVSHTIYPAFWLQGVVFFFLLIIWMQHVFLKVCISIIAEKKLTNNISPFYKLVEDLLGVSSHEFGNYLVTAETVALGCFGLELLSRSSIYLGRAWHQTQFDIA